MGAESRISKLQSSMEKEEIVEMKGGEERGKRNGALRCFK